MKTSTENTDWSTAPWASASEARMNASSARPHIPTPTVSACRADRPIRRAMPPALRTCPTITAEVSRRRNPTPEGLMSKVMEKPSDMKKIGPRKEYAIP